MLINIRELGMPKKNVITQSIVDEWDSELSQLLDMSENLTGKHVSENFMSASRELIRRVEQEVWIEQKRITHENEQLKLLKEAKANLLIEIAKLQGEAL